MTSNSNNRPPSPDLSARIKTVRLWITLISSTQVLLLAASIWLLPHPGTPKFRTEQEIIEAIAKREKADDPSSQAGNGPGTPSREESSRILTEMKNDLLSHRKAIRAIREQIGDLIKAEEKAPSTLNAQIPGMLEGAALMLFFPLILTLTKLTRFSQENLRGEFMSIVEGKEEFDPSVLTKRIEDLEEILTSLQDATKEVQETTSELAAKLVPTETAISAEPQDYGPTLDELFEAREKEFTSKVIDPWLGQVKSSLDEASSYLTTAQQEFMLSVTNAPLAPSNLAEVPRLVGFLKKKALALGDSYAQSQILAAIETIDNATQDALHRQPVDIVRLLRPPRINAFSQGRSLWSETLLILKGIEELRLAILRFVVDAETGKYELLDPVSGTPMDYNRYRYDAKVWTTDQTLVGKVANVLERGLLVNGEVAHPASVAVYALKEKAASEPAADPPSAPLSTDSDGAGRASNVPLVPKESEDNDRETTKPIEDAENIESQADETASGQTDRETSATEESFEEGDVAGIEIGVKTDDKPKSPPGGSTNV